MKHKRAADRPRLAAIQPNETALIYSPEHGFRQASPRRTKGELTLEELFLLAVMTKTNDEDFMQQVVANHFGQFTKH